MPQNAISRLESPDYGKATLTTLKRIASAFDVGLVVRFVPFTEFVDWVSGTPRVDRGLSFVSLGVQSFDNEERNGEFNERPLGYEGALVVSAASELAANIDPINAEPSLAVESITLAGRKPVASIGIDQSWLNASPSAGQMSTKLAG